MVAAAVPILRIAPLRGESEQRFLAIFTLSFRKRAEELHDALNKLFECDFTAPASSSLQKASFTPNWICLDGPAEKTFPNCIESAVALGKSKFG